MRLPALLLVATTRGLDAADSPKFGFVYAASSPSWDGYDKYDQLTLRRVRKTPFNSLFNENRTDYLARAVWSATIARRPGGAIFAAPGRRRATASSTTNATAPWARTSPSRARRSDATPREDERSAGARGDPSLGLENAALKLISETFRTI